MCQAQRFLIKSGKPKKDVGVEILKYFMIAHVNKTLVSVLRTECYKYINVINIWIL